MTVVPRPINGSYTTSPGAVKRSMKNRGSWGLKQARYETSCRLCAARCLLVQNSLTKVSTTIGRFFARPTLVTARLVRRSEEHTSELQSQSNLVCRLLLEKKKKKKNQYKHRI